VGGRQMKIHGKDVFQGFPFRLIIRINITVALNYYMILVFILIIASRDAKLVYGCDVEERKRCARKLRKRRILERTSQVTSDYIDHCMDKLKLRKTKVCCLLWLPSIIIIFRFLGSGSRNSASSR
jgi:hypothetical protein